MLRDFGSAARFRFRREVRYFVDVGGLVNVDLDAGTASWVTSAKRASRADFRVERPAASIKDTTWFEMKVMNPQTPNPDADLARRYGQDIRLIRLIGQLCSRPVQIGAISRPVHMPLMCAVAATFSTVEASRALYEGRPDSYVLDFPPPDAGGTALVLPTGSYAIDTANGRQGRDRLLIFAWTPSSVLPPAVSSRRPLADARLGR